MGAGLGQERVIVDRHDRLEIAMRDPPGARRRA